MAYSCPTCGRISHNRNDEIARYCSACDQYEADMRPPGFHQYVAFLEAIETVAEPWLAKLDELAVYERGDKETAALASVLKQFMERRKQRR